MAEERRPPVRARPGEMRGRVTRGAGTFRPHALTLPRVDGVVLAEIFLVAAVVTVLIIRAILMATGYPQLGGGGLHVAHVLWGGLLMLAGLLVLFLRLGAPSLRLGALLAGVGFGFFIDEIGKFVTSDVNYFFQPAVAMIYVVFVAIAIVLAVVRQRMRVDGRTALANALALFDVAVHDPAAGDTRQQVLTLLDSADPNEPLVPLMRDRVRAADAAAGDTSTWWQQVRMRIARAYVGVADSVWFPRAVTLLFAVIALSTIVLTAFIFLEPGDISFTEWIQLTGTVVTAVLIAIGLFALRKSRLRAYRWFERGILVDLLVTEVFLFYHSPGTAFIGVAVDIALLVAIRMASRHEVAMDDELSTPSLLRLGL